MNAPSLRYRRTFRDALHATEREAFQREPQPPAPCNFCAPDIQPDRFEELRLVLGRYWLLWVITYSILCGIAALAFVALVAEMVAP